MEDLRSERSGSGFSRDRAFSADWLALREPADTRARSSAVVDAICGSGFSRDKAKESRLKPLPQEPLAQEPLSIVDLGAGTGANLRYLAPRLGGRQEWLLVDSDRELLGGAHAALRQWAAARGATFAAREREITIGADDFWCTVRTVELDLARNSSALALPRGCLVTASALLDLVSRQWLEALADACRDSSASVLFALTYDGRMTLEPADPDDDFARTLFNRHQLRDKGFGPALGPDAAEAVREELARRGYVLTAAASDWRLDGESRRLQAETLDGWLGAAGEIDPDSRPKLEGWHARHSRRVEAGQCRLVVGHSDVAGRL